MSPQLVWAIVTITLALVFYTWGVFAERRAGRLTKGNLLLFWLGFAFDTTGTTIMTVMAEGRETVSVMNWHAITGALAIVLMLVHALWATYVLLRGSARMQKNFHKFSIIVWAIWLVPYVLGMVMGMGGPS